MYVDKEQRERRRAFTTKGVLWGHAHFKTLSFFFLSLLIRLKRNVTPWSTSNRHLITIHGLNARPDLNGLDGIVLNYIPSRERYHVKVLSGVVVLMKKGRRGGDFFPTGKLF